jgi:membrane-bound metal-dependent hydrolase YbcI (DUF457 family)
MVLALAPDFDFIPGIFAGQPALYHRGPSHSVLAAVLAGLVGAALFRKAGESFFPVSVTLFLAYLSHLVLDVLGPDGGYPYGMQLFWPFSASYYLSPVQLLPGVQHAATTNMGLVAWLRTMLSWHNVYAVAFELAVFCPALLVIYFLRARRPRRMEATEVAE